MGPRGARRRVPAPLFLLQKWALPSAAITCYSSQRRPTEPAEPRSPPGGLWPGEGTPVLPSGGARGAQTPQASPCLRAAPSCFPPGGGAEEEGWEPGKAPMGGRRLTAGKATWKSPGEGKKERKKRRREKKNERQQS